MISEIEFVAVGQREEIKVQARVESERIPRGKIENGRRVRDLENLGRITSGRMGDLVSDNPNENSHHFVTSRRRAEAPVREASGQGGSTSAATTKPIGPVGPQSMGRRNKEEKSKPTSETVSDKPVTKKTGSGTRNVVNVWAIPGEELSRKGQVEGQVWTSKGAWLEPCSHTCDDPCWVPTRELVGPLQQLQRTWRTVGKTPPVSCRSLLCRSSLLCIHTLMGSRVTMPYSEQWMDRKVRQRAYNQFGFEN